MRGASWQEIEGFDEEHGWPCQRLRLGFSLVLFFFFEVLVGKKLPPLMPFLMLGAGLGLLVSARFAIRDWRLALQLAAVRGALEARARRGAPRARIEPVFSVRRRRGRRRRRGSRLRGRRRPSRR
jgi:hypothetical protein